MVSLSMLSYTLLGIIVVILDLSYINSFRSKVVSDHGRKWTKRLSSCTMQGSSVHPRPYTAVMIVPTGVGAKIGGYAGDALPSAKLLSTVADILITHPNVMNGAMLYWPVDNILYVEGHALNEFAANRLALRPLYGRRGQKIGVILDKALLETEKDDTLYLRHLQVIDAARATLGIDIEHVVVTSQSLEIQTQISPDSGASWGTVAHTQTLIQAAEILQKQHHCTAIAVIGRFPEDEEIDEVASSTSSTPSSSSTSQQQQQLSAAEQFALYRSGQGVDAIAGIEALISHIISKRLHIPCAHAPAFAAMDVDESVSPKACAEELGYTFLPCVLAYLHRAPDLILLPIAGVEQPQGQQRPDQQGLLYGDQVDAVVVPYNALGGPAVLSWLQQAHVSKKERLIIAVEDNLTSMQVTKESLQQWQQLYSNNKIIIARSYAEVAGLLAAHKAGILLASITPMVDKVQVTRL